MKYKKGLTSIGIPIWLPKNSGKEKYVKWTLDSLVETTDKNFEIILINNEATKETDKFLESFRDKFLSNKYCKGFKIISRKDNTGWTGGWELSIEASQGEYFMVANDDLVFSRNYLSKLLKHFKKDTGVVGPVSNYVSGLQNVKENKPDVYEEKVNWLIGFCMLFRRKALDVIKNQKGEMYYIDPIFYPGGSEELDVCFRLTKAGYDLFIARDVFIHHFGSKSLVYIDEYKNPSQFFRKRIELLLNKHGEEYKEIISSMQKCPKIAIGIPTVGEIDHSFLSSYHWVLQNALEYFGIDSVIPIIAPRNLVHIGRSEIVRKAILFGAESLLFLDDDGLAPSDIIKRLYEHQKDFVTAIVYTRVKPFDAAIYKDQTPDGSWIPCRSLREGLVEIDNCGLAATLIKMSAIKRLLKKKQKEIKKRGGLFYFSRFGEDFNFNRDLVSTNSKLYADTDIIVGHLGNKQIVNSITYLSYKQQQEALKQDRLKNRGINN